MSDQKKKFLTTGEMAKDLGAAPRTVAGWCDGGKLQHYRLPTNGRGEGDRRIPINQAIKFCQDNGVPVPQSWLGLDVDRLAESKVDRVIEQVCFVGVTAKMRQTLKGLFLDGVKIGELGLRSEEPS